MQSRETKLLMFTILGCVALFVVYFVYAGLQESLQNRENQVTSLERSVSVLRKKDKEIKEANHKLTQWRRRSLPTDREARAHYFAWLLSVVEKAKLEQKKVEPQNETGIKNVYDKVTFQVTGQGKLGQVAQLLYDFYNTNHLHLIRKLTLTPQSNGQLSLLMIVEGLSLPKSENKTTLNAEKVARAAVDLPAYQKGFVARDFFAEYKAPIIVPPPPRGDNRTTTNVPPDPPRPPPVPPFDTAKHAYVSGIIEVDGEIEVWIDVRTTGEILRLREGDKFTVGKTSGEVTKIGEYEVELMVDGKKLIVLLGDNLRTPARANDLSS